MEPGNQWCSPGSHFDTRTFILADIVDDSVTGSDYRNSAGTGAVRYAPRVESRDVNQVD